MFKYFKKTREAERLSELINNNVTYFQMINLMMTYYMANENISIKDAYERAITEWGEARKRDYIIDAIFNLGPR